MRLFFTNSRGLATDISDKCAGERDKFLLQSDNVVGGK